MLPVGKTAYEWEIQIKNRMRKSEGEKAKCNTITVSININKLKNINKCYDAVKNRVTSLEPRKPHNLVRK